MTKNTTLLLISFFLFFSLSAQNTDWVLKAGGPFSDKATSVDTDTLGNIYLCGFFNNGATFGSITKGDTSVYPGVHHDKQICLAKLDSNGVFQWVVWADAFFDDRALGLFVSPDGYSYVTGTCWGDLEVKVPGPNFLVNQPTNSHDQSVILKIGPNGTFEWGKIFAASNGSGASCPPGTWREDDHAYDVAVAEDGFIYMTGFFSGIDMQLDGITLNNPNWIGTCDPRGYVCKLDINGNVVWAHEFDGIYDHRGSRDNRIAIDHFSNVYVVGTFKNTATFGSQSITSKGGWDASIFKMDKDGNYLWAKGIGSNKDDRFNGIAIDYADNVYVTGEYRNPMVFIGANASNGTDTLSHSKKRDIFVAKITTNGDWVWAKRARSKGVDKSYQMSVDDNMQVYVGGSAGDSLKLNNNITLSIGNNTTNAFVAQLDGSDEGDWVWGKMGGGTLDGFRTGDVCEDGGENIYAAGFLQGNATIDGYNFVSGIDESGQYKKDIFVWKIKKDQNVDVRPSNTIYIDVQPPGAGTINLTGTGTTISNLVSVSDFPCYQSLSDSVNQVFEAVANTGYQFDHWDWGVHNPTPNSTTANSNVFTYSNDTLIVYFQAIIVDTITYIVQPVGSGTISVDASTITTFPSTQYYNNGNNSFLSATANAGYVFSNWSFSNNTPLPNNSTSNVSLTWSSNDTCIVNFSAIPTYNITYINNPSFSGANIDIDNINTTVFPYTQTYLQGDTVELMANNTANFIFDYWSSQNNILVPNISDQMVSFEVSDNDTIIANYNELDTLWVVSNPSGVATLHVENDVITTTPFLGMYQKGTVLQIEAFPNGNNVFNQWNLNNNNLPDYNTSTLFTFINSDTLFAYFNNVLSVEDLGTDLASIKVYPNVLNHQLLNVEIESKENANVSINLLNLVGQKVNILYQGNLKMGNSFKEQFQIENLSSGVYFVQIQSNKSNAIFKVVKK